jgi:hypothetical protein
MHPSPWEDNMQPHETTAASLVGDESVDIEVIQIEGSEAEVLDTEKLNIAGLNNDGFTSNGLETGEDIAFDSGTAHPENAEFANDGPSSNEGDVNVTVFDLDQDPFIEQVIGNLYKLGLSWQSGGDFASAEVVYLLILELKEMYPDMKCPEVVLGCSNLADVLNAVDRNVEAEHYYLEAIKLSVSLLGLEHPSTAIGLRNYAEFLRSINLLTEADDVSKRAQQIFAQSFHRLVATLPNPDGGDPADQAEVLLFGQRLWRGQNQSNQVRGYNVS